MAPPGDRETPDVFDRFHLARRPGGVRVSWADQTEGGAEVDTDDRGGIDSLDCDGWDDEDGSSGESSVS